MHSVENTEIYSLKLFEKNSWKPKCIWGGDRFYKFAAILQLIVCNFSKNLPAVAFNYLKTKV